MINGLILWTWETIRITQRCITSLTWIITIELRHKTSKNLINLISASWICKWLKGEGPWVSFVIRIYYWTNCYLNCCTSNYWNIETITYGYPLAIWIYNAFHRIRQPHIFYYACCDRCYLNRWWIPNFKSWSIGHYVNCSVCDWIICR